MVDVNRPTIYYLICILSKRDGLELSVTSCLQEREKVMHPDGGGGRGHKGMEVDPHVGAVDQTSVAHKRHCRILIIA